MKKHLNGKISLWNKGEKIPYCFIEKPIQENKKLKGHDLIECSQHGRQIKTKSPWNQFNPGWLKKTDEAVVNEWLCMKNMHPKTQQPLYWEDLIPNVSMEDEINRFTDDKIKEYIKESTVQTLLEKIEMEAEDERSQQFRY